MSKKVKVAAIQIQYPDGEVKQVSVDDAKELYRQLHDLFGEKVVYQPSVPVIIERERWPRWTPYWTDTTQPVIDITGPPERPTIWCCTDQ